MRGVRGVFRVRKSTSLMSPGVIISGGILTYTYESLNGWKLVGLVLLAVFINEIFKVKDTEEVHIDPY